LKQSLTTGHGGRTIRSSVDDAAGSLLSDYQAARPWLSARIEQTEFQSNNRSARPADMR
jgi:hypothetical protein